MVQSNPYYFMLGPSAASQFNLSLKQVVLTPQLH